MNHQRSRVYQLFGTAVVVGIAGAAIGAPPTEAERGTEIEPIEWVEISIHMPDGRVIKTKEHRFPSRSRVLMLTGKLPMLNRGSLDASDGTSQGADGEGALVSSEVDDTGVPMLGGDTEGAAELGEGDSAGIGALASAPPAMGSSSGGSVGASSTTSTSSGSSASLSSSSGSGGGGGAVRSFKKSS